MNLKHEYLVNDIYNYLPDNLISLYKSFLKDDLKSFIDSIIDAIPTSPTEVKELKTLTIKRRNQQKKRYLASVLKELDKEGKNPKYILKEWKEFIAYKEKYPTNNIFPFSSKETFVNTRIEEIETWANDPDSSLTQFLYIRSLTENQVRKAFEYEILIHILEKVLKDYGGSIKSYIIEHPNIFIEKPIFSTKFDVKNVLKSSDKNEVFYESNLGDSVVKYFIPTPHEGNLLENKVYATYHNLDSDDLKKCNYILSLRGNDFITSKKIKVYFTDLLKYLNLTKATKNYDSIKKQFERLSKSRVEFVSEKEKLIITFFQSIYISEQIPRKSYIEFTVSDFLYDQIVNQETCRYYKNQIESFKNDISTLLIGRLQKDRLKHYNLSSSYKEKYSYADFLSFINFSPSYSVKQRLDLIEEGLKEFCQLNIIVKKYSRISNEFIVHFIPLSDYEIKDFASPKFINDPL